MRWQKSLRRMLKIIFGFKWNTLVVHVGDTVK